VITSGEIDRFGPRGMLGTARIVSILGHRAARAKTVDSTDRLDQARVFREARETRTSPAMFSSFNARAIGRSMPSRQAVEIAARVDFGGIDLLVRDLIEAGDDPAEIGGLIQGLGLRAGAWPLPVDWRGDDARFRHDLAALPRFAEAAAVIGLSGTGTWVRPAIRAGSSRELDLAWHRDRLGAIARVLADHGQTLGLEVIGVRSFRSGTEPPFLATYHALPELLRPLHDEFPNVGVLLDLFHVHAAQDDLVELLANPDFGPITWVHVADLPADHAGGLEAIRDERRGLPGDSGLVALKQGLALLSRNGYDGPVTVEPLHHCAALFGCDDEEAARRTRAAFERIKVSVIDSNSSPDS
jgi:sugar phosphate isomerase/epimerase